MTAVSMLTLPTFNLAAFNSSILEVMAIRPALHESVKNRGLTAKNLMTLAEFSIEPVT